MKEQKHNVFPRNSNFVLCVPSSRARAKEDIKPSLIQKKTNERYGWIVGGMMMMADVTVTNIDCH
jgi:hypothetical protein